MKSSVGSSGGGQVKNTNDQVLAIEFHARSGNAASAYAGMNDVGPENGRELTPGESFVLNFTMVGMDGHAGRTLLSEYYVSCVAGDKVDWAAVLK